MALAPYEGLERLQKIKLNHRVHSRPPSQALCGTAPNSSFEAPDLKLQPEQADGVNIVSSYDDAGVTINGQTWRCSVLLPYQGTVAAWPVPSMAELTSAHIDEITALDPELVILGSGPKLKFASPAVLQPLMARRIGVETMDTRAACRTYNILVSEGRRAVAILMLG